MIDEEEINRPSCSQSIHTSDEEAIRQSGTKNLQPPTSVNEESIASSVQTRKRNRRRTRKRSSPEQQATVTAIRSSSSASEEQISPTGNKLIRSRISGSPSSSSIGISMTTAEPSSNDAQTPTEVSMSPESGSDGNSRPNVNEGTSESQPTKQRSKRGEGVGKRGRGAQKKPVVANRIGSTMRTRFGGKPTSSLAQVSNIYSAYERCGKYERIGGGRGGRKNGKGKGVGRRGRGKVISAITKTRGRQAQYSTFYNQNSSDNNDGQGRHRSHDDNDYVRTAIVTSAENKFMDSVSVCLICGSVGRDAEGAM